MIQKSHFWVYSQRKGKQDSGEVSILPYLLQLIHNSKDMETIQVCIKNEWMKKWLYIYIYFYCVCVCVCVFLLLFSCQVVSGSVTPWIAARQAFLSLSISWSLPQFMSVALMMPSSLLILWHPLLPLPSIFPSIRDFSNELAIHIRWPSYHLSISPSSDYSGLISLKIDWFVLYICVSFSVLHIGLSLPSF